MKTAETLNDKLFAKADFELSEKLEALFKPISDFAYNGLHSGKMDHAQPDALSGDGYFKVLSEVWPPHIVKEAKKALFEGMKRNYREEYVANFIAKVNALGEQIESLQQEIQQ